jgi:adhesin HecA-like repeat protein
LSFANEILDAIEIMVKQVVEDNTTKIYTGICKTIATSTCVLTINGKDNTVKYYGGTPTVGTVYQVFIPFGNMSAAFIIVPGAGGQDPETGVSSVNGKTGAVVLTASDVGALPNTTTIPTKTSQLDNDSGFIDSSVLDGYAKTTDIPTKTSQLTNNSGFITANDVPVKSVDGSTGTVVTNAVKTISQSLTNEQKAQARTNIGAGTSSFDGDYNSLDNKPTIPTQTSQLENNSGFITSADVPTKVSQLDNDTGFITPNDVPEYSVVKATDTTDYAAIYYLTKNGVNTGVAINIPKDLFVESGEIVTNPAGQPAGKYLKLVLQNQTEPVYINVADLVDAYTSGLGITISINNEISLKIVVGNGLSVDADGIKMATVTTTTNGAMSSGDKVKLDGIESGAQKNTVTGVKGDNEATYRVGNVNITKANIGLSNVDNVKQYSANNPPPYPVTSVNNKTGTVVLDASDVGALPDTTVIPVVNDATLDVQRNGVSVGTFTANASIDKTINITVPTKASDVGAVATSDITQVLGASTTKVPSEKAVSDAIGASGGGDMLKATYDPDGSVATAGGIPAYVETNGGKIDTIKVNGTVQTITDKTVDITVPITKGDIGLGKVENIKQYSANNPPPYPVTSVNGQTGDVTVSTELPEHLVKYDTLAPIETTTLINADTLQGHAASYFATSAEVSALSAVVDSNADDITANAQNISTNTQNISTLQSNISTLQSSVNGKVSKSGDTMTGALIAQNNTNYSVAQVRNIIISTSDPSGGNSGDIWIKYTP